MTPSGYSYSGPPKGYLAPFSPLSTASAPIPVPKNVLRTQPRAGDILTPREADCACETIGERHLFNLLSILTGVQPESQKRLFAWLLTDVRLFISHRIDLGAAYAICRTAWRFFNMPNFDVAEWRRQVVRLMEQMENLRTKAVTIDAHGEEVVSNPYSVMPRRMWDLKSNRVVDFRMRMAEFHLVQKLFPRWIPLGQTFPYFWAVTHAWTADMTPVETTVNENKWPVPMPAGVTLEQVRNDLIELGGEYVWLDVVCLRQEAGAHLATIKADEWKIDVPTIGNIYVAAAMIVRYFNGLGRAFSPIGWDDSRHWLKRAWTLQEIRPEAITHTAGVPPGGRFLDTTGSVNGETITLQDALSRIRKLTENAGGLKTYGCKMFDVMNEMRERYSSNPVDKVSGVLYLVRSPRLPAYRANITAEDAWTRCCHNLNYVRRLELLFDFPYRGTDTQWFPTWAQITDWPARNTKGTYAPPKLTQPEVPYFSPSRSLLFPAMFVRDVYLLPEVRVERKDDTYLYHVKRGLQSVIFDLSYHNQVPIPDGRYTIASTDLAMGCNWAVCLTQGSIHGTIKTWPPTEESNIVSALLKKIGILRCEYTNYLTYGDLGAVRQSCVFI